MSVLRRSPFKIAQRHFSGGTGGKNTIMTAVQTIVTKEKWRGRKSAEGREFDSFAECAIARAPYGLGAVTHSALNHLRFILLNFGFLAEWLQVLEKTVREPGRPPPTVTNGEDNAPVFVMSKSPTSIDRILHRLRDHPDILKEVCAGRCSIYRGAITAGLVRPRGQQPCGYQVGDLAAASTRNPAGRLLLVSQLFEAVGLETQCTFISRILEPRLGPELAKKWRLTDEQR